MELEYNTSVDQHSTVYFIGKILLDSKFNLEKKK